MKKNLLFLFCLFLSISVFTACAAKQTESSDSQEQTSTNSSAKDTITLIEREIPSTFDPSIYPGSNHYIKNGAGELLFRVAPDGSIYPSLAKESKQIDEHTWMITLRPEAKFWSGQPVNAKKVIGSLERSRTTNTKAVSTLEGLAFEPASDYEIKVTTKQKNDSVPLKLAHYELCIINPDFAFDSDKTMDMTGFYKIVEFTPKEKMILVRNEDYYGDKPTIKNVTHEQISDQETRALSILSKHGDIVMHIPNESVPQLETDEDVKIYSVPAANTQTIYLNLHKPYLSDPKVRQALAWGLDRQDLVLIGTEGKSHVTTNWLSSNPKYKAIENAVYQTYEPDKAATLLDEAGWKLNSNRLREKDGTILQIKLMTWGQDKALGEAIQSQWTKLGVDAQVQYGDYSLIQSARETGDWDAFIEAWTTYGDEYSLLAMQYLPEGSGNYGGYESAEITGLLKQLKDASSEEEKMALSKDISLKAAQDAPCIYICPRVETIAVNAKLKGFIEHFRHAENGINAQMEYVE